MHELAPRIWSKSIPSTSCFIHIVRCFCWIAILGLWSPDRAAAQYTQVSVGHDGTPPDATSYYPSMSADGRYVAFFSYASNLVPGDTNKQGDLFVRDIQAGTTTRVSVTSTGAQGTARVDTGHAPSISANGRFVAFETDAALVPGADITCTFEDCGTIYVHDLQTHQTTIASKSSAGVAGNGRSAYPEVSADGRYVLFSSIANNLVPNDTNGKSDVFLHDRQTGATTRVSTTAGGGQLENNSVGALMSGDGNIITWHTLYQAITVQYGDCPRRDPAPLCTTASILNRATGQLDTRRNFPSIEAINGDGRYLALADAETVVNGSVWAEYSVYDRLQRTSTSIGPSGLRDVAIRADGRAAVLLTRSNGGGKLLYYDSAIGRAIDLFGGTAIGGSGPYGTSLAMSGDGSRVAFTARNPEQRPGPVSSFPDLYVLTVDGDRDGMPDAWETTFGLNPLDPADAATDADGDGRANLAEFLGDTHPTGKFTQYLAEGSSNDSFTTYVAILNPHATPVTVSVRLPRGPGEEILSITRRIPAHTRITVDPYRETERFFYNDFSTVIESAAPVVVDRTMRAMGAVGHGATAEAATQPSTTWFFAEGATGGPFSLFYLLLNPGDETAHVTIDYLRPAPEPVLRKTYDVAPRSRHTISVDMEGSGLASANVSAKIVADRPIVAERSMYLSSLFDVLGAAEGGAGARALASKWFLAEGATGSFFDLYVLIANPGADDADVVLTYLLPDGTHFSKSYLVAKESRQTIFVDAEDVRLANTPVSIIAESTSGGPIVVERAQWWPEGRWYEGHLSIGATVTATKWGLADGFVGGREGNAETFILIANTSPTAGSATVTLMFEDGGAPLTQTFTLQPNSRTNVPISTTFPEAIHRPFGAVVESSGVDLVVERAMYRDLFEVTWASGTAALGTPLP